MCLLRLLCKLTAIVFVGTLSIFWSAFLFLIDLIGGWDEPEYLPQDKASEDEIDYARHFNDVYDNHHSRR